MGDGACFTIDDVTRLTGVSRRTVRFYITLKLIPPPDGRGVGLHYGQEHVDGILRIADAKRQGQTLAAIAREEDDTPPDAHVVDAAGRPGFVVESRAGNILIIPNAMGTGTSLVLKPGARAKVEKMTVALENAEGQGLVVIFPG